VKVRWTPSARRDLVAAIEFLRSESPRAARALVQRVDAQVNILRDYSLAGPEGRVPGTRELFISRTRYVAVYRVLNDEVSIIRLLHQAQEWPSGSNERS